MSNCMRVTFTALSPALPRSPVPASPSIPSGSLALIAPRADHPSHNAGPSTWSQQNQNKRKRIDITDLQTPEEGPESKRAKAEVADNNTPFADQVNPWSSAPGEEFLYLEDAVTTVDIDASPKPVKLLRRSRAHSTCTAAPPPTRYRKSTYPPVRPSPLRQDITQALLTPSEEDEEKDEYDEYVVCESEFLAAGTALAEAEIFKLVDVNLWGRD